MNDRVEPADLIGLVSHASRLFQIRQIADDSKRYAVEQIPHGIKPLL